MSFWISKGPAEPLSVDICSIFSRQMIFRLHSKYRQESLYSSGTKDRRSRRGNPEPLAAAERPPGRRQKHAVPLVKVVLPQSCRAIDPPSPSQHHTAHMKLKSSLFTQNIFQKLHKHPFFSEAALGRFIGNRRSILI